MSANHTRAWLTLAAAGVALAAGAAYLRRQRRISFRGASVIITGGSRGLGLEIARRLADEGAHLALLARDDDELQRAGDDLRRHGAEVIEIPCDVRDRDAVFRAVSQVLTDFGGVDAVFNVAGIIQVGPHEHMRVEDYAECMDVHFWGPLHMMQAVEPTMKSQGGGRIVNIASIGGLVSIPHLAPYCASKFALVGLSDTLRAEMAKDGIHVTTVCPGLMRTGSHLNALFKGKQSLEYTWFSVGNALPTSSVSSGHAAKRIVEACRAGDPFLIISPQAWALHLADAVMPHTMAAVMRGINRLLPGPKPTTGDELRPGWQSPSRLSPSWLTRLSDQAALQNNEQPGA